MLSIISWSRQMGSHFFAAAHFFPFFGGAELFRQLLREAAIGYPSDVDIENSAIFIEELARNAKAAVKRILEERKDGAVEDYEVQAGLIAGIGRKIKSVKEMQDKALGKPFDFERFNGQVRIVML